MPKIPGIGNIGSSIANKAISSLTQKFSGGLKQNPGTTSSMMSKAREHNPKLYSAVEKATKDLDVNDLLSNFTNHNK